jgi:hypothetical protein
MVKRFFVHRTTFDGATVAAMRDENGRFFGIDNLGKATYSRYWDDSVMDNCLESEWWREVSQDDVLNRTGGSILFEHETSMNIVRAPYLPQTKMENTW